MEINTIVILGLATWRISSLLVNENGPFHVFRKIREMAGIKYQDDFKYLVPSTFFAELLDCVWCSSVWVSFFVAALYFVSPERAPIIFLPFALSAIAILVELVVRKVIEWAP